MSTATVLQRMDEIVDKYCQRNRFQNGEITPGIARMFVKQHRLNTRQRNSVLKLRVATNCTDWDTKLKIIKACSQEIIADHEFADGKPHWQIVEDLGVALGLSREEITSATPIATTEIAWAAWAGLMSHCHWLEGIVANACAERANVPGYGFGAQREHGSSWVQRHKWQKTLGLRDDQLAFWTIHEAADLDHSNLAWKAVAQHAEKLHMEDEVVHACEINLKVWEMYWHGIVDAGSAAA